MRTRADKIHYSKRATNPVAFKRHFAELDNVPICQTKHGKKITLTEEPSLVTCNICRFHIGLHRPLKDTTAKPMHPEVGKQLSFPL
jgi:hypothetical protein